MAKRRLEEENAEDDSIEPDVSILDIQTERPVRKPTRRSNGVITTVAAKDV